MIISSQVHFGHNKVHVKLGNMRASINPMCFCNIGFKVILLFFNYKVS